MRKVCLAAFALFVSFALATPASASTIDFESFAEFDGLSNQVAGVTFSDLYVLTAGSSLNDYDFPPQSGVNVATNSSSTATISFAGGISSFSAYFTYAFGALTLDFYDGASLLGSITSAFTDNYVSSGNSPNELLQFSAGNTTSVVINGVAYTLDDMSYVASVGTPTVPEPSSVVLLITGMIVLAYRYRSRLTARA